MIMLCSVAPVASMLDLPTFVWDQAFGENGCFLTQGMDVYDYNIHFEWW